MPGMLSLVIPVYRNQDNLPRLFQALDGLAAPGRPLHGISIAYERLHGHGELPAEGCHPRDGALKHLSSRSARGRAA